MKRGGIFMAGQETYLPVAFDKPEQLVVWAIEFRRQIEDSVRGWQEEKHLPWRFFACEKKMRQTSRKSHKKSKAKQQRQRQRSINLKLLLTTLVTTSNPKS